MPLNSDNRHPISRANNTLPHPMYLRIAQPADLDALHEMLCLPQVFEYLADGAAPPLSITQSWINTNHTTTLQQGGLWLLMNQEQAVRGCVLVTPREEYMTGELIYALHPDAWGQGYATRMSETVMQYMFSAHYLNRIIAGADASNKSSIKVMERLDMRFLRNVDYPAGQGVEYEIEHQGFQPRGELLTIESTTGDPV
ncbi:MAG: GNAT family N-acetyltransferase [Pseudomonadota bacterium]